MNIMVLPLNPYEDPWVEDPFREQDNPPPSHSNQSLSHMSSDEEEDMPQTNCKVVTSMQTCMEIERYKVVTK